MAIPVPHLPLRVGAVLGLLIGLNGLRSINPALGRFGLATLIALWSGSVLTICGVIQHQRIYEPHQAAIIGSAVLGFLGVVTLVVWCGQVSTAMASLSALALAILVVPLTHPDLWLANPWKFGLSWPVTTLALVCAQRRGRAWTAAVLSVAALLSAVLDTRSMLVFCFFSMLVLAISFRAGAVTPKILFLRLALVVTALWLVANAGTDLAVGGAFGRGIQEKTVWQQTRGGNLMTSARAEIPTSLALIAQQPWGYGLGVVPNLQDRMTSVDATVATGGDELTALLGNSAVSTFRLHSQLADLWFFVGLGAFPMLGLMASQLARGVLVPPPLASAGQGALLVFVLSCSMWDFLFSPFENNYVMSAATIGFLMILRSGTTTTETVEVLTAAAQQ